MKFLFEETKAARICLLPKPLAVAQLFNVITCIVVDSGATNTSIWVINQKYLVKIRKARFGIRFWIKYLKPLFNATTNLWLILQLQTLTL